MTPVTLRVGSIQKKVLASPAQAMLLGAPSRRRLLGIEHESRAPLFDHARKELGIGRQGWVSGPQEIDFQGAHLVPSHGRHGFGTQDLLAVRGLTVVQEHLAELQVIAGSRVEAAAPRLELWVLLDLEVDWLQRSIGLTGMNLHEPVALAGCQLEARAGHSQWREDVFVEIGPQRLAADPLDRLPRPVDVDSVFPPLARIEQEWQIEGLLQSGRGGRMAGHLHVAGKIRIPDRIAESRGMCQQVA